MKRISLYNRYTEVLRLQIDDTGDKKYFDYNEQPGKSLTEESRESFIETLERLRNLSQEVGGKMQSDFNAIAKEVGVNTINIEKLSLMGSGAELLRMEKDLETGKNKYYVEDKLWECYVTATEEEFKQELSKLYDLAAHTWSIEFKKQYNTIAKEFDMATVEEISC